MGLERHREVGADRELLERCGVEQAAAVAVQVPGERQRRAGLDRGLGVAAHVDQAQLALLGIHLPKQQRTGWKLALEQVEHAVGGFGKTLESALCQ